MFEQILDRARQLVAGEGEIDRDALLETLTEEFSGADRVAEALDTAIAEKGQGRKRRGKKGDSGTKKASGAGSGATGRSSPRKRKTAKEHATPQGGGAGAPDDPPLPE